MQRIITIALLALGLSIGSSLGSLLGGMTTSAQAAKFPFQDPKLDIEVRVQDLLSRLSTQQKIAQMMNEAEAVPDLEIPAYDWWNEGLHGMLSGDSSTVFPQAIGMAASWNQDLLYEIADVISTEGRALYHRSLKQGRAGERYMGITIWSPNINIVRDPRWGRAQETYGEDPYLTSRLAVQFIRGLQGNDPNYYKTIATPKHFAVHSGPDPLRHEFNAVVTPKEFWETYMPAFEASIVEAKAYSIMTAYNAIQGIPASANKLLLQDILRRRWNFDGYVVSDCGAVADVVFKHKYTRSWTKASALSVLAGTDLNCGTMYKGLRLSLLWRQLKRADIDRALARLIRARMKLGMFDPPEMVPYAKIPASVINDKKHWDLSLQAARESIVLLKNKDDILPLDPARTKKVVVFGANAQQTHGMLGNYTGKPSRVVSPLEGIKKLAPGAEVTFVDAAGNLSPISKENLLRLEAEYYDNARLSGTPVMVRGEETINHRWGVKGPEVLRKVDEFSIRWTGQFTVPSTGEYKIGVRADDGVRLWVDGKRWINEWKVQPAQSFQVTKKLEAGKPYSFKLEYFENKGSAEVALMWAPPQPLEVAKRAVMQADVAIAVMGLTTDLETEELDKETIQLPKRQLEVLQALSATKTPVVLVLTNGSAVSLDWAKENVAAIVEAWYPGQEGGTAIGEVLWGKTNPSGRLPVTFYADDKDLGNFKDYSFYNRTYRYFTGEPTYRFGDGLSYSRFDLAEYSLAPKANQVIARAKITNHGPMTGSQVLQVYAQAPNDHPLKNVPQPKYSLAGFAKLDLSVGQTKEFNVTLDKNAFTLVDRSGVRHQIKGEWKVWVGIVPPDQTVAPDQGQWLSYSR